VRLLLVDDDPPCRAFIGHLLESAAAEVGLAHDGAAGVDAALSHHQAGYPFHLILMDLHMPVMDGQSAAAAIRHHGLSIPIIAITSQTIQDGDWSACFDACLIKPVDPRRLFHVIAEGLKTAVAPSPDLPRLVSTKADDSGFAPLLAIYLRKLTQVASQLEEAIRRNDRQALRGLAHRLKGTGTSYGFPQITETARECEAQLADACCDLSGTSFVKLIALLQAANGRA
jgi:CheY-like chemotaxis protein